MRGMDILGFGHRSRVVSRRSGSLAVLLFAAILLALATPAQAAFPGKNGKIAFSSFQGNQFRIEVIEPDGTGRTVLFPGGFDVGWAADGERLAFSRGGDVFTARADGSDELLVFDRSGPLAGGSPSYSPDGTMLAIGQTACFPFAGCFDSVLVGPASGPRFDEIVTEAAEPAWSPDGLRIAFSRTIYQSSYGIATIRFPSRDGLTQLTDKEDHSPNWSPDGTKIAFARKNGGSYGIWIMNADGSGQTRITNNPTGDFDSDPAWSPDGSKIVFVRQGDLYTINPDGTGEANITKTATLSEFSPDWQPFLGPRRSDYKNAAQFCKAERDSSATRRSEIVMATERTLTGSASAESSAGLFLRSPARLSGGQPVGNRPPGNGR